jgi:transcriptional regulator with XRE-family HTH domain
MIHHNGHFCTVEKSTMPMTPLQRKAAFRSAATLNALSMSGAARRLGVSYNHLMLVLAGNREGSIELKTRLAKFLGYPVTDLFTIQEKKPRGKRPKDQPPPKQQ